MVRIIQQFRRESPIANSIRSAANTLFGDHLTPALKRAQLNRQNQIFAQSDAEQRNLVDFSTDFDQGTGVRAGLSASDIAGAIRSRAAAAANAAGGDLLGDRDLNAAQLGAGQAASSTGLGSREAAVNAANRSRTAANIGAGATVRSAEIRAAQAAEANRLRLEADALTATNNAAAKVEAARLVAEADRLEFTDTLGQRRAEFEADAAANLDEFNRAPETVIIDGQPTLVRRVDAFGERAVETATEAEGRLLGQNFDDLDALNARQAAAVGALPSATEVQGIAGQQVLDAGRFDPEAVSPEAAAAGFGFGEPAPPEIQRFQSRDGTRFFTSTDGGFTDNVTNEAIPQDVVGVDAVTPRSISDAGGLSPTTANATAVFNRTAAIRRFKGTAAVARATADRGGESIFGAAGLLRRGVQGAANVARGLDAMFGGEGQFNAQLQEAQRQLLTDPEVDPAARDSLTELGFYDPDLDKINKVSLLLVYQGASAFAGQEGRGLSDRDVQNFERIFGNPQGVFASKNSFMTSLGLAEELLAQAEAANVEQRQGQFNTEAPGVNIPVFNLDGVQIE